MEGENQELVSKEQVLVSFDDKTSKLDLVLILTELYGVDDYVNKFASLNIDKETVELIKKILDKSPKLFENISNRLDEILLDNVLNTDDVPVLVKLIKDILNLSIPDLSDIELTVEKLINLVKKLLELLINKDYIKVENKEKVFTLISISFELLSSSVNIKQDIFKSLVKFFNKIFTCCK